MSACLVHYDIYDGSKLVPLQKEYYDRLISAKECRMKLGGENKNEKQSYNILEAESTFWILQLFCEVLSKFLIHLMTWQIRF